MEPNPERIASSLLAWNSAGPRRTFPWQHTDSPYCVWVSEIMLQQTRAETVVDYYLRFMEAFGDVRALAGADEAQVLRLWSGLGYYARARNLHRAAQALVAHHGGSFPCELDALLRLPGIGRSTAGAIRALGLGERGVILDGNVRRVLSRLFRVGGDPARAQTQRQLWQLADQCTPPQAGRSGDYAQAVMNFGAVVCTVRRPGCDGCVLRSQCGAYSDSSQQSLPARRNRPVRPVRRRRWLLVHFPDGSVLLEKVWAEGLWSGLWVLPEVPDDEPLPQAFARLTGLSEQQGRVRTGPWRKLRHGFTHFELHADVHAADAAGLPARIADSERQFIGSVQRALRDLALPSPVSRLLREWDRDNR